MKFTPSQVIEMAKAAGFSEAWLSAGAGPVDPRTPAQMVAELCTLAADRALEAAAVAALNNGVDSIPIHGDDVVAEWLRAMKEQQ